MAWLLEHYPAGSEWEKTFATEAEAVAELHKHICPGCLKGCGGCVGGDCETCVWREPAPDPKSASDLLCTPCGCEYGLSEVPAAN